MSDNVVNLGTPFNLQDTRPLDQRAATQLRQDLENGADPGQVLHSINMLAQAISGFDSARVNKHAGPGEAALYLIALLVERGTVVAAA